MLSKKIIFLTGATGTMGEEGLKQILSRSDRFNLRVLVRPSAKNKAFMSRYEPVSYTHLTLPTNREV